jgi:hypothetical protein
MDLHILEAMNTFLSNGSNLCMRRFLLRTETLSAEVRLERLSSLRVEPLIQTNLYPRGPTRSLMYPSNGVQALLSIHWSYFQVLPVFPRPGVPRELFNISGQHQPHGGGLNRTNLHRRIPSYCERSCGKPVLATFYSSNLTSQDAAFECCYLRIVANLNRSDPVSQMLVVVGLYSYCFYSLH